MTLAAVLRVWAILTTLFAAAERLPDPATLTKLEGDKNVGLAALEEGTLPEAMRRFESVRQLAPGEPLGWADGAVAAIRSKDLAGARRLLDEAARLAPASSPVLALRGTLEELSGDFPAAVASFGKAAAGNPKDLVSRWSAARLLAERVPGAQARALEQLNLALREAPANVFLLARLFQWGLDSGDKTRFSAAWEKYSQALEEDVRADEKLGKYVAETKIAWETGDAHAASLKSRIVENLLRPTPRYQQARRDVEPGVVGLPLEAWSPGLAAMIRARPHAIAVRFAEKTPPTLASLTGVTSVRASGKDGRDLVFAGSGGLVIATARDGFRPSSPIPGSAARVLEVADVNNSGELDFVTPGGLWTADKEGFRKIALPAGERVVPIDYDSDGDLDLYVSSGSGDRLMRNNLDGTWTDVTNVALPRGTSSRWAVAADFDRDGDIDLVLAKTDGGLALLDNLRGGKFSEREAGLPKTGRFLAVAAGDLNGDGRPDLVWTTESAAFVALNRGDGTFLPATEIAGSGGGMPLLFDFDNDGTLDLFLAATGRSGLWRNDGSGVFSRTADSFPGAVDAEAVDVDGDGDLDLILVTPEGKPIVFENQGGNANGWIDVALEGLATGSAKVNRFGYGSEIEVKAAQLYAWRVASRPVTHVGIGASRKADVLRVVWTNGIPQNRLSPPVRTLVSEVQQLKGSCPFLYAYDGRHWSFVSDVLGRSPVGLLYDGLHQAAADTQEWLVIPGEKLKPVSGSVRLDFTEELWETVYFDSAELYALDHPRGIEIVPNEKMVPPPFPAKRLYTISHPGTPSAVDERGRDRTGEISELDGRFLAGFAPTRYQGIVETHDLVLSLPQARGARKVMLYLTGWIQYSDTSINVSLSQGGGVRPFGPELSAPDGLGGWTVVIPMMGYPAGKTKPMPVDLSGLVPSEDPRVRIRTNLAIYWDRIAYTIDEDPTPLVRTEAPLASARLFFRGFSRMTREFPDGPQVFVHDDVDTAPRWADMSGYYTRWGDVRGLLKAADDRYVVMCSGDAVALEFDVSRLPNLPPGWVRDWMIVLDGWEKDADKNTVAGQTVEPLPFHGMDDSRYGIDQIYPDDAAHRQFRAEYLTRLGGPDAFRDAVRNRP
jgi:tetratricopeptide (TPR) repeat protein